MKKLGRLLWRLYLAFMIFLALGFAAYFLGTPWGYLNFYLQANDHLDHYFGGDAKVTGVSYDFKSQRYLGSAEYEGFPGATFALRLDRTGDEPVMCNYYHLLFWEQELLARYQPQYPDFTLNFHLPITGSPHVSPRVPEDFPSIFALESPGDFLTKITIDLPETFSAEELFALVTELDAAFPQTDVVLWQGQAHAALDWLDRTVREDCAAFSALLAEKFGN